ncbi:MAG: 16S rRNA (cytosine(1402)-N(4))-methyltransferase RsmH [Gemmataceae bacterium]|nr:16S rRNA (cytosine(1402)-N(4))-methyltransferase RsmH [Gemmataceae bacterium]
MPLHVPVLPNEVLHWLDPRPGQIVVDATVGAGGHARLVLERLGRSGRLVCLDQDPCMLALAREQLQGMNVTLVHRNFEDLPEVLQTMQLGPVDAVLADLGFCSDQTADPKRGLSFQRDGPLDMRLDPARGEPAGALVHRLHEKELADLFWQYGEERHSRRIARKIVQMRQLEKIETTGQLAELVRRCVPRSKRHPIDPATRVFQALRIAVNDELGALQRFLDALPDCLKRGGRAVVISFHSLEDRLVKRAFRQKEIWQVLTKKPVLAGDKETRNNPRARSAKLRAGIRCQESGVKNQESGVLTPDA